MPRQDDCTENHILLSSRGFSPEGPRDCLQRRVARRVLERLRRRVGQQGELLPGTPRHFWQARLYDFNVWTEKKRIEKLRYMHRNPVARGLVASPEQWRWSSYRAYAFGEQGIVAVNATLPPNWTRKKQAA